MKHPITLEEKRKIQLDMLQEVDTFCREHNIRYSLSSGTLIGAIRHKGFIPWDDDLDITMPLPDMYRFRDEFLSDKIKYCDVDTERNHLFRFSRLAYLPTYSKSGLFGKGMGVNIDLYPIVGLSDDENVQKEYFKKAITLYNRRKKYMQLTRNIRKISPLKCFPGTHSIVRQYRDWCLLHSNPYDRSKSFYRIADIMKPEIIKKDILIFDFFDVLIDIPFENIICKATGHYQEYLTQKYGDYMKLPPESERVPLHSANYYWK